MKKLLLGASATAALLHSGVASSQVAVPAAPPAGAESAGPVIVTGTRTQGLKAVDSAAPVQVIDSATLQRSGQSDVMQALGAILPSFTVDATGFDTANLTLSARLRGLSPNDALVLVNGKRRHTTANLHVDGGSPSSGAATADLSLIPLSAVDHIEVLLDGAAAQYGTDAIAGVINIILKSNASGGQIDVTGGKYIDGGGKTGAGSANFGLKPLDNAFVNVSAEKKYHGFSDRGAIDGRAVVPSILNDPVNGMIKNFPGFPNVNHISGDAQYHTSLLSYNAGYDVTEDVHLYSFATWGSKQAASFENYRLPSRIPKIYPLGFNPQESLDETDYGFTFGGKGVVAGWNWDASVTQGADLNKIGTIHSGNASLNGQFSGGNDGYTPTDFHDGNFRTRQTTVNLDVSHDYNVGWTTPLTVAAGVEYRTDGYQITAGDPASYYVTGAQSFYGYSPADAGKYSRNDKSGYVDFAASPVKDLQVDLAARFEHYSDFGSATVGKLTSRYDFTPAIAMRGTIGNGFRAPTLAEEFYSGNNVGPDYYALQLPPNSAVAKSLGIDNLKPEKSVNLSLGLVAHPTVASTVTLDAYQIALRNRVVASGSFNGYLGGSTPAVQNQTIINVLTARGIPPSAYEVPDGQGAVQFFTNGADTKTRGIDLVFSYASDYAAMGKVDWSLAGNYTHTQITRIGTAPVALNPTGVTTPTPILDITASSVLTSATPKFRITGSGVWKLGPWSVLLRETLYGQSSFFQQGNDGNYYNNTISVKLLTDVEVSDQITKNFSFSLGAKNLFNTYPNKLNSAYLATFAGSNGGVTQYPLISPFGINGGYYYARATYKF